MRRLSWAYITKEATSDEGMPAKDRSAFHYFNENGLYAELKKVQDEVAKWCEDHPDRPNGVLLVHGSLNDFPRKMLQEALDAPKRRKDVTKTTNMAISTVYRAIKEAREWLADPTRWPEPKAKS